MSMRQKTRQKKWQTITANAGETGLLGGESVDAFRGYFLPLVEDGNALTSDYIGANYPNGTIRFGLKMYKEDAGLRRSGVSTAGGVYGEDALEIIYDHWACTFSAPTTVNAPGHGLSNGDSCALTIYDPDTDSLPTGLTVTTYGSWAKYTVVNAVAGVSIELSTDGVNPISFSGTGSNPSGGSFGVLSETGLPGFWGGIQAVTDNPNPSTMLSSSSAKMLGDITKGPYNRFEFYVKHPAGFRAQTAAKLGNGGVAGYPAHNAYNFGTYHASFDYPDKEEGNNHFYFQVWPRHDLSSGQWVRYKFGDHPTHERGSSQPNPPNPVPGLKQTGNFWDTETRFYMDEIGYWTSPQIYGSSLTSLYDRMRIYYEDPPYDITVAWDDLDEWVRNGYDVSDSPIEFPFTITNNESFAIDGVIQCAYASNYNASLKDSGGTPVSDLSQITLPSLGTWSGTVVMSPANNELGWFASGITFTPLDQLNDDGNPLTGEQNFSDYRLERRWENGTGPYDAHKYGVAHKHILCHKCTVDHTTNRFYKTAHGWADGARVWIALFDSLNDVPPTGFSSIANAYYVHDPTADDFQLKTTAAGVTPVDFTDNGTTASGYFGIKRA